MVEVRVEVRAVAGAEIGKTVGRESLPVAGPRRGRREAA